MNYRNARLANGFLSLDKLAGEVDLVKSRTVSDRGAGVERMVGDIDRRPGDAEREERVTMAARQRRIDAARQRLRRAGLGYLIETFLLICKNGKNRDESMHELAARRKLSHHAAEVRYFGHREKILDFFHVQ